MRTFSIQTLGCKVNQYESDQIAGLLRLRGLEQVEAPAGDVRIVNTCSVTMQAASKSRQTIRRMTGPSRLIVTGCWATSDRSQAAALGADAVITHHDDVAAELDRLLAQWQNESEVSAAQVSPQSQNRSALESGADEGLIIKAGTPTTKLSYLSKSSYRKKVNENFGTMSLPMLGEHQTGRQRAFLKVQDGCDAHCSYCIIPSLRPRLWSKSIDDAVEEAKRLVASGHVELVLTGIFLGAYGQPTALRRRQTGQGDSIAHLIDALCTSVPDLGRLRLSSLEPGDLTSDLLAVLASHPQVVPHFHLPLQSGSALILRRMNRQYTRDDFLRMIDAVQNKFDRPALTTDIIVGFPGETDDEFAQTLEVVERAGFIHIHAFSFSPRPGTAAARWAKDFVHGPIVNQRINVLNEKAQEHSFVFRKQFLNNEVQLLVEQSESSELRHGRCERYFSVYFENSDVRPGDLVRVRIDRVTPQRTLGTLVDVA